MHTTCQGFCSTKLSAQNITCTTKMNCCTNWHWRLSLLMQQKVRYQLAASLQCRPN